jgi:hypothetical protein
VNFLRKKAFQNLVDIVAAKLKRTKIAKLCAKCGADHVPQLCLSIGNFLKDFNSRYIIRKRCEFPWIKSTELVKLQFDCHIIYITSSWET